MNELTVEIQADNTRIDPHTPKSIIPAGQENNPFYYVPPYDKDTELQPNYFCRARNVKREKYCRAQAGRGTDHFGVGRCRNHGGSTPIKHGRYSEVVRDTLGEHLDRLELETDEEKLDVMPEAQLLRGLTMTVSEKFQEYFLGIIEWNKQEAAEAAAMKARPRFLNVPDLKDLATLAKQTAEIVNMINKNKMANAISLPDFYRLMSAMGDAVIKNAEKHLKKLNPSAVDRFLGSVQEDWRTLKK